jgi:DNA-binding transcriptional regulator YhcF (GntR family)
MLNLFGQLSVARNYKRDMRNVFEKIQELEGIPGYSKHQQLVQGFINSIDEKILERGDQLPSVNTMIKETGFARETIVKGYKELIERGIIESKNRMGYYISNTDTGQPVKIALLLYAFDSVQQTFYKAFRDALGPQIHIDVFFHHQNIDLFETIINNINGKYGMYVVTPMPHPRTAEILKKLPINKFLMIDRLESIDGDFSYVTQEFEESSYRVLVELLDTIRQFDEIVFFSRPNSDLPIEITKAFKRFVKDYKINYSIKKEYLPGSVEKGKVYFLCNDMQTWILLKDCKEKGIKLGTEIGILSQDDDPVKEIICDGITTYSADFELMAQKAANFVLNHEKTQEVIPTVLKRRNSL